MPENISPDRTNNAFPYGADQPVCTDPFLSQRLFPAFGDSIYVGVVTGVSTKSHSCTVSVPLKTSGAGALCFWASGSINRWGGVVDSAPPTIGSAVAVYLFSSGHHGVILGHIPVMSLDPEKDLMTSIDRLSKVSSFDEDSGQGDEQYKIKGFHRHPHDIFPGERFFHNELGVSIGLLRTMAMIKGSELAKIEAFMLDDLLRIVGHNYDLFTAAGEKVIRDDHGLICIEEYEAVTHRESMGVTPEGEQLKYGKWRRKRLGGALGDIERDFILIPSEKDPNAWPTDIGLSEIYRDGSGLLLNRTVVGGGIIKSRSIGVPLRLRDAIDPEGAEVEKMEASPEDLADFGWNLDKPVERSAQVRDAIAWIMGRQANARLGAFSMGKGNDMKLGNDSPAFSGSMAFDSLGANSGAGKWLRDEASFIPVHEKDKFNWAKKRHTRIGDAWILVLPDGTVSIRDIAGSEITMSRGHITISASKDINLVAGRNIHMKAGDDITVGAYNSVDVSASNGQTRVFAKKSAFLHSENGGVMISTNTKGTKGEPTGIGEKLEACGIHLTTPGDVTIDAENEYTQLSSVSFLRGRVGSSGKESKPRVFRDIKQELTKTESGSVWNADGQLTSITGESVSLKTTGDIRSDGDIWALGACKTCGHDHDTHEDQDFGGTPPSGSASVFAKVFNAWENFHGIYTKDELSKLRYSFRTEEDYGTKDDFAWTQKAWMREWENTGLWGNSVFSQYGKDGEKTYPFPGKMYWEKEKGFYVYNEINLDKFGNPKVGGETSSKGGDFSEQSFSQLRRHP